MSIKERITRFLARRRPPQRLEPVDEDARRIEKLVRAGIAANKFPPR
jgi:hypothetical protein